MLMLHWSLMLLIALVVAALLGFGAIAGAASGLATVLFVGFLFLGTVTFVTTRGAI